MQIHVVSSVQRNYEKRCKSGFSDATISRVGFIELGRPMGVRIGNQKFDQIPTI